MYSEEDREIAEKICTECGKTFFKYSNCGKSIVLALSSLTCAMIHTNFKPENRDSILNFMVESIKDNWKIIDESEQQKEIVI